MSLFGTLRTGASGLGVSGASLGVIGDNIANLNTTGYKRNNASFADMMPEGVFGLGGPAQLGRGATNLTIGSQFTQGSLNGSGNALDMALNGNGWFKLSSGTEDFYSRDGSFGVDVDGFMVNAMGYRVQGYNARDGLLSPVMGDLRIDDGPIPQKATEEITLDIVLSPDDPNIANTGDYSVLALDGATETLEAASAEADFSTSITVYDSLGQPHEIVLNFEKDPAAPNTWNYSAVIDAGETDLGSGQSGFALEIATGSMEFDTEGVLVPGSQTTTATGTAWSWPGTDPFTLALNVGDNGAEGSARSAGQESSVTAIGQDGYTMGSLTSLAVDADGVIRGQYTNGQELALGQVAVATFTAESGLNREGGNMFRSTYSSGDAAVGAAGTGTRGSVVGYALERSNVDLEAEFVNMIQAQRSYQANAGVVRTADETLQELVNLV